MIEFQFLHFITAVIFVGLYTYGESAASDQSEVCKNIGLLGVALLMLNWFIVLCPSVAVFRVFLLLIIAAFIRLIFWIIERDKKNKRDKMLPTP